MTESEVTLEQIREAFRLFCRSEQAEGRGRLLKFWDNLGPDGDVFLRSVVAHYLADTEIETDEALKWDQRALEAAKAPSEDNSPSAAAVKAFLPSLHLNLADGYRKLGDWPRARYHADRAMEACDGLGVTRYGQNVRGGIVRVDTQIEERYQGPSLVFDFD